MPEEEGTVSGVWWKAWTEVALYVGKRPIATRLGAYAKHQVTRTHNFDQRVLWRNDMG